MKKINFKKKPKMDVSTAKKEKEELLSESAIDESSKIDNLFEEILKEEKRLDVHRDVKSKKVFRDFEAQRSLQEKTQLKKEKEKLTKKKKAKYKVDLENLEKDVPAESGEKEKKNMPVHAAKKIKEYFFGVGRELLRITYLKPKELKSDVFIIISVIVFFVFFLFLVDVIFIILNLGLI